MKFQNILLLLTACLLAGSCSDDDNDGAWFLPRTLQVMDAKTDAPRANEPLTLNFIAIVLAITGTLNPVVGALVHNAGSVLVITNSALLLKWRQTALAEFRVRRREICLIVNSDDRRVGIYSLRGARVAAAPRAARHKAQRILFKKSGLQNCNPLFLIFCATPRASGVRAGA